MTAIKRSGKIKNSKCGDPPTYGIWLNDKLIISNVVGNSSTRLNVPLAAHLDLLPLSYTYLM